MDRHYIIRTIVFSFLVFFYSEARSQYSIAGTHGAIYVDIIPDTLLSPQPQSDEPYYIDINQDGTNDIKIDAIFYYSNVYTDQRISVTSLNSNTSFMNGGYMDTTWYGSPPDSFKLSNSSILKIFNSGDTIHKGMYASSGTLAMQYTFVPLPPQQSTMTRSWEWINMGDKFFGVKYQTASDTSFGWAKVNVSGSNRVLIEEFSLGTPLASINSISDFNQQIAVYPNPVTNELFVLQNIQGEIEINLFDVYGKEIKTTKSKMKETEIDVSGLSEGIYFLRVKTAEGALAKKIIVQR